MYAFLASKSCLYLLCIDYQMNNVLHHNFKFVEPKEVGKVLCSLNSAIQTMLLFVSLNGKRLFCVIINISLGDSIMPSALKEVVVCLLLNRPSLDMAVCDSFCILHFVSNLSVLAYMMEN